MIIHDVQQNTPEWASLRAGKFCASEIHKLFMGKSTKGYNEYLIQIARERVTGKPVKKYQGKSMIRGHELEPDAINQYMIDTFQIVKKIGFVEYDEWRGFSPDGFIGNNGIVQAKCLEWNTFESVKSIDDVDRNYTIQCQSELLFSGREWDDLYLYDPDLESKCFRILPDEKTQKRIMDEIDIAKEKVLEIMKTMRKRNG